MARKRASRNRDDSNPSTVLVVFMVFFILLSIGLGVGTYYGYAGQKELRDKADSALKKASADTKAAEYYRFQALAARAADGPLAPKSPDLDEPGDLAVAMEDFESGNKWKEEKTRPVVEAWVAALKKELGWSPAEKKFATTWAAKFNKLDGELKTCQADKGSLTEAKNKAEEKLRGLQTKYEKDWADTKASITKDNQAILAASKERTKQMDEQFAQNKKLADQLEAKNDEMQKLTRASNKTIAELKEKNTELETRAAMLKKQRDEQIAAAAQVNANLMAGDFAGKWTGTLKRGGAVTLDIRSDGTAVWSVPGITRENVSGVSRLEKSGAGFVVPIQNQPVQLFLSNDRQTLRLTGHVEATLTKK